MSDKAPDWKVLNDWACSARTTEMDVKADEFAEHPDLSIFVPKSASKGFYVGWVSGQTQSIQERNEARAMVKELIAEVRTLLAPMNELLTHADGPEADRVFPQYEFDALRTLILKAEAMS